jgi:hypothetical protein
MPILSPTTIETVTYGTAGWNAIYSSNFQKINDFFRRFDWSLSTITYSSTITVNWNTADAQIVTLTGNPTINFSNPRDGGKYALIIRQDATGGRTVTWGSNIICDVQPIPIANSTTTFFFIYDNVNTRYILIGTNSNNRPLGVAVNIRTSSYTITTTDCVVLGNATSGNITFTLPAASNIGMVLMIKKIDSSANTVTITRAGSDTIEEQTSIVLSTQYASRTLVAVGSNLWLILAST